MKRTTTMFMICAFVASPLVSAAQAHTTLTSPEKTLQTTAVATPSHAARTTHSTRSARVEQIQLLHVKHALTVKITRARTTTHYWQNLMRKPLSPSSYSPSELQQLGVGYLRWSAKLWQHRAAALTVQGRTPPNYDAWLCIHHGEAAWNGVSNTTPTYYGGLQMDAYFEATYGAQFVLAHGGQIAHDAKGHAYAVGGHANLWTPIEQIWTAEAARASGRGFYPWPNTAHVCGLI